MSDLISRQAAIDAIKTWGLLDGLSEGQAIEILADAEKLPSAQPEILACGEGELIAQPDIVRCKYCKYQDKWENDYESWNLCGYRPWLYVPITDDHFCGYAKRKDGEADDAVGS